METSFAVEKKTMDWTLRQFWRATSTPLPLTFIYWFEISVISKYSIVIGKRFMVIYVHRHYPKSHYLVCYVFWVFISYCRNTFYEFDNKVLIIALSSIDFFHQIPYVFALRGCLCTCTLLPLSTPFLASITFFLIL